MEILNNIPDAINVDNLDINYEGQIEERVEYPPLVRNLGDMIRGQELNKFQSNMIGDNIVLGAQGTLSTSANTTTPSIGVFSKKLQESDEGVSAYRVSDAPRELAFEKLSTGEEVARYDEFVDSRDNEDFYAQRQTTGEKWMNGMTKFVGDTMIGTVGNIAGSLNGVIEGISEGSLDAVFDNSFYDYLDDKSAILRANNPNFYTEKERELGLTSRPLTANFWADKVLSGASFTASIILSESLMGLASGGSSLATTGARVGANIARSTAKVGARDVAKMTAKAIRDEGRKVARLNSDDILKRSININATRVGANVGEKIGKSLQWGRFTYMTSAYESGFETRMFKNDMMTGFEDDFTKENGRTPTISERMEFQDKVNVAGDFVFGTNMVVVGSSNLFGPVGYLLGRQPVASATGSWTSRNIFGAGLKNTGGKSVESIVPKTWQKIARIPATQFKYSIPEALEEGAQGVISGGAEKWVNTKFTEENYSTLRDLLTSTMEYSGEYVGTVEGQEEMLIGLLIGAITGNAGAIRHGAGFGGAYTGIEEAAKKIEAYSKEGFLGQEFAEKLIFANRTMEAVKDFESAILDGDPQRANSATDDAILAQMMYAEGLGYVEDTIVNIRDAMQTMPVETIMEKYNIPQGQEGEAEAIREKVIKDYNKLTTSYRKNRDFVDKYIGSSLTKEEAAIFGNKQDIGKMKELLTYALTTGETSYEQMKEANNSIIAELANIRPDSSSGVMSLLNTLDISTKKTSKKLRDKISEVEKVNSRISEIEAQRDKRVQNVTVDINQEVTVAQELEKLASEEVILLKEKERLLNELNTQKRLAEAEVSPFSESSEVSDDITEEDLNNLQDIINEISQIVSTNNPFPDSKTQRIKQAISNYNRSVENFKGYNELVSGINNKSLQLTGKQGLLTKFGGKNVNDVTKNFINYLNKGSRGYEQTATVLTGAKARQVIDKAVNEVRYKESPESTIRRPLTGTREELTELINDSEYVRKLKEDKGFEVEDIYDMTSEELDELTTNLLSDPNLVETEKQLIQRTLRNPEGISAEEIMLQEALVTTDTSTGESVESGLTVENVDTLLTEGPIKYGDTRGLSERSSRVVQTYENAFIIMNSEGKFTISNISPRGLLESFGYEGNVEVTNEDGSKVLVPLVELNNYKGTTAKDFSIEFKGVELRFTFAPNGNISIETEVYEDLVVSGLIEVYNNVNFRTNKYIMLYSKGKPLATDYTDNGVVRYSPEEVYNMQKGTEVYYVVPTQDPYNIQLMTEYNKKPLPEELAKVESKMKVLVVTSDNKVIGDLKSIENTGDITPEFLAIRELAITELLSNSKGNVVLKANSKVEHVYIGLPNLTIEGGELQLQDIDPKDVVDFGYVIKEGNTYKTKTNKKVKDINIDIVQKLGKKNLPIVVLRRGSTLVAIPVIVNSRGTNFSQEIVSELQTESNKARPLIKLLQKMKSLNMRLSDYGLEYLSDTNNTVFDDSTETGFTVDMVRALDEVTERNSYYDYTKWADKNTTIDEVIAQAKIPVNSKENFMISPKVIIDMSSTVFPKTVAEIKIESSKKEVQVKVAGTDGLVAVANRFDTAVRGLESKLEMFNTFDKKSEILGNIQGLTLIKGRYKRGSSIFLQSKDLSNTYILEDNVEARETLNRLEQVIESITTITNKPYTEQQAKEVKSIKAKLKRRIDKTGDANRVEIENLEIELAKIVEATKVTDEDKDKLISGIVKEYIDTVNIIGIEGPDIDVNNFNYEPSPQEVELRKVELTRLSNEVKNRANIYREAARKSQRELSSEAKEMLSEAVVLTKTASEYIKGLIEKC